MNLIKEFNFIILQLLLIRIFIVHTTLIFNIFFRKLQLFLNNKFI